MSRRSGHDLIDDGEDETRSFLGGSNSTAKIKSKNFIINSLSKLSVSTVFNGVAFIAVCAVLTVIISMLGPMLSQKKIAYDASMDMCSYTQRERPGATSEDRCLALTGCCYTELNDHCEWCGSNCNNKSNETSSNVEQSSSTTAATTGVRAYSECKKYVVQEFPTIDNISSEIGFKGEDGGDWSACTHLRQYGMNFAPDYARFLAYCLQPKTVLEFGGGLGTMSDFLARFVPKGSDVTCIEPEPMLAEVFDRRTGIHRPRQLAVDIFSEESQPCVKEMKTMKYDLVVTLEVVEHITPEHKEDIVNFLVETTNKFLVFSAARPNQGGTGHIPESSFTKEQWIKTFEEKGLVYLPQYTKRLSECAWGAREYDFLGNTIVMVPNGTVEDLKKDEYPPNYSIVEHPHKTSISELQEYHRAAREHEEKALWPELYYLRKKIFEEGLCQKKK